MTTADISLVAGMRDSLLAMQNIAGKMALTQKRLATGLKVNSALDDPVSFFASQAHLQRAADLSSIKDGMSEGCQVIQAANNGINGLMAILENMRGLTQAAMSTSVQSERDALYTQYSDSLDQLTSLANDSSYGGSNLNAGQTLSISFDTSGSQLTITGFDNTAAGLGVTAASAPAASSQTPTGAGGWEPIFVKPPTGNDITVNIGHDDTVLALKGAIQDQLGIPTDQQTLTFGGQVLEDNLTMADYNIQKEETINLVETAPTSTGWNSDADISASADQVDSALSTLRTRSQLLSSSLGIVSTRSAFDDDAVKILRTGSDKLTLADMNEEGANMLMLQTQQSLCASSLSIGAQSAQSVLRLF